MYTYRGLIARSFMFICGIFPLQNKAVFSSFDGKAVSDNPREIYLELRRQKPDIKFVWVLNDNDPTVSNDIVVKPYSFGYLFHLSTAKLWIDNSRKKIWVRKRKGQYYVQTWHGDIALKKIEKDAEEELSETYIENAKYDSTITDLMISGSDFGTRMFKNSFWYNGEILELGSPKSTVYYLDPENSVTKVKKHFGLSEKCKIALYCPTFRNDNNMSVYNIDYKKLLSCLDDSWGGNWTIVVRLHPKMKDLSSTIDYNDKILNGSDYPSTNELIIASDLVITDYSSCMFDGLEANKKVFLYAPDIDDYLKQERGMYFDIRELPFPLSESNSSLEENIRTFDCDKYTQSITSFKKSLGLKTNSNSTRDITTYIVKKVWN